MFLPTLHFKHVSCWRFICSSFPGGDSMCQHPSSCKWGGRKAVPCAQPGPGDGDKGPLLSLQSHCQGGAQPWSPHSLPCSMQGSLQQDAGQVNGCRMESGTSVGQSSMQDKDVAPASCFPPLRSACQDFSQFAFLKRGCSFKSLISASFSLKT